MNKELKNFLKNKSYNQRYEIFKEFVKSGQNDLAIEVYDVLNTESKLKAKLQTDTVTFILRTKEQKDLKLLNHIAPEIIKTTITQKILNNWQDFTDFMIVQNNRQETYDYAFSTLLFDANIIERIIKRNFERKYEPGIDYLLEAILTNKLRYKNRLLAYIITFSLFKDKLYMDKISNKLAMNIVDSQKDVFLMVRKNITIFRMKDAPKKIEWANDLSMEIEKQRILLATDNLVHSTIRQKIKI